MSKAKNRVQLYNLKNQKQVLMGEKAAKLMADRYPAEFRIVDKTITRNEAIKQGHDMVYAPGYDTDYQFVLLEEMTNEDLLKWKPYLGEKNPYEVNESEDIAYYNHMGIVVVPSEDLLVKVENNSGLLECYIDGMATGSLIATTGNTEEELIANLRKVLKSYMQNEGVKDDAFKGVDADTVGIELLYTPNL